MLSKVQFAAGAKPQKRSMLFDRMNGSMSRLARVTPSPRKGGSPGTKPGSSGALNDARDISMITTALWLMAWLMNNVGITMMNKYSFSVAGFPYPFVASAFHMLCNWVGTLIYFWVSGTERKVIKRQHWRTLIAFSFVFSLNIGVGNVSQKMVPVSFNQVMRSLVPVIVMIMGINMFGKTFSRARKIAVVPVVIGVALACYGKMVESALGFGVTVLCIILAAFKVVLSGEMLTGEIKMPPMHLLGYMTPLALVQLSAMAIAFGEVTDLMKNWEKLEGDKVLFLVGFAGVSSFSLNLLSLKANKITSPLTLSIMANVKQVLLIAFSSLFLKEMEKTMLNIVGFVVVAVASTRYSMICVAERDREIRGEVKLVETGTGPLLPK